MPKLRELLIGSGLINESKTTDLWLTRDTDDTLVLSMSQPKRDSDFGWIHKKGTYFFLPDEMYPEVKSDDEKPRRVRLTLI